MTPIRTDRHPIGAAVTLADLTADPHPRLAQLRAREPVSWLPALDGWLVTRHYLALRVLRDAATFTVDDPRFSTGRVVGRSMLTSDGRAHARHRNPFAPPFRRDAIHHRFTALVTAEVDRLIDAMANGRAELRRGFAGPLAAAVVASVLGLEHVETGTILRWYDAIVASVSAISAGEPATPAGAAASARLRESVAEALDRDDSASLLAAACQAGGGLTRSEVTSNAAVLLFGGIETTEGMIANAVMHLLAHPDQHAVVEADREVLPNAIEESLRLEPAAAVVDRYATRDVRIGEAEIRRGDLVSVSIAGANRDPAVFADPARFDVLRRNAGRQIAFARGPHVCIGMHLARLEARIALARLLHRLPRLRLDPDQPVAARGLVFRKPPALPVRWG
jgi:cytochrome P450